MATKKPTEDKFEEVASALTASELFIEKHRKLILYIVAAVVAAVLLVLAIHNFYLKPHEAAAENAIYNAEMLFQRDSFALALNGNGNDVIGFKEIISDYGFTKSGNLASAYSGICCYKLGDYNNAIKYLSQYNGNKSHFTTIVIGLIGDSYAELNDTEKAVDYFEKVANAKDKVMSPRYLKKAGIAYEALGKKDKALKSYTTIKDAYPASMEASDIDKYVARVE